MINPARKGEFTVRRNRILCLLIVVIMAVLACNPAYALKSSTLCRGSKGEKVRQLQEKLVYLELLDAQHVTGTFGTATAEAVRLFQEQNGLRVSGIANISTQLLLDENVERKRDLDPATWQVIDDGE